MFSAWMTPTTSQRMMSPPTQTPKMNFPRGFTRLFQEAPILPKNISLIHLAIITPFVPRFLLVVVALTFVFLQQQGHVLHRPRNLLDVDAAAPAIRKSFDPISIFLFNY